MQKRRRKYTEEFKEEAVKLIFEQGYHISEAARNLGVHPNLLGKWKREYEDGSGTGDVVAMKAEVNRLRKENKRLKLEREILKKGGHLLCKRIGLRDQFINTQKKVYKVVSFAFIISVITLSPAFAGKEVSKKKIGNNIEWHEGVNLTGPQHHFDLKIGGKINYDIGYINADNELQLAFPDFDGSHSDFRSLSASLFGHIFDAAEFKLEVDFANVKDIKDSWIRFTKGPILPHFTFGHMKEPFSLDMLTSSTYLTFMESALPTRVLAPFRKIGITVKGTWVGTQATWAGGYFLNTGSYSDVGEAQDQLSESNGSDLVGRITGLPLYKSDGKKLVHLGFSYLHRFRNDNVENPTTQFRTRPESHLTDDRLVSTPLIYDQGQNLVCLEAAWMNGPVSIQGEYFHDFVDSAGTLAFKGWYLQGSWVLTGEARKYRTSTGVFTGITPNKEFNLRHSGWGAWELALRISEVDLNDNYILGGEERNITLGFNWYLSPKIRFMINYINAVVEDRADPLIYEGDAEIIMSRIQVNF